MQVEATKRSKAEAKSGVRALVPDLVADDDLPTANAMESLSFGVAGAAGPALAGVHIGLVGAAANLALDAATFFLFVGCLLLAKLPEPRSDVETEITKRRSAKRAPGLGPAARFIVATPAIAAITVMFMGVNLAEGMLAVLLPVYARDVLAVDAAGYGLLASAFTAGLFVGALTLGAVRWRWPLGRWWCSRPCLARSACVTAPCLSATRSGHGPPARLTGTKGSTPTPRRMSRGAEVSPDPPSIDQRHVIHMVGAVRAI